MKALIVGASGGVGRALSEVLAARGDALLLAADLAEDLQAQSSHLRLKYGAEVAVAAGDARHPREFLDCIASAAGHFDSINGLFFPIGASRRDDRGALPVEETRQLLDANLGIVIDTVAHFLPGLVASGSGNIVGFSSVAAIRGRSANVVYAAAKRGLESYFESIRHLTASTRIRVQCYRLGYVATRQTFGQRLLFPLAAPENVARTVARNLDSTRGLIYYPAYWSIIASIVSTLPWPLFKRMSF